MISYSCVKYEWIYKMIDNRCPRAVWVWLIFFHFWCVTILYSLADFTVCYYFGISCIAFCAPTVGVARGLWILLLYLCTESCAQSWAHVDEQFLSSLDWVLSHWAHFTVPRFVVFVSVCWSVCQSANKRTHYCSVIKIWPNQQCQSTEGRIRLQSHQVHPTVLQ